MSQLEFGFAGRLDDSQMNQRFRAAARTLREGLRHIPLHRLENTDTQIPGFERLNGGVDSQVFHSKKYGVVAKIPTLEIDNAIHGKNARDQGGAWTPAEILQMTAMPALLMSTDKVLKKFVPATRVFYPKADGYKGVRHIPVVMQEFISGGERESLWNLQPDLRHAERPVFEQFNKIRARLPQVGLEAKDVHGGNYLIKNGTVKIIDAGHFLHKVDGDAKARAAAVAGMRLGRQATAMLAYAKQSGAGSIIDSDANIHAVQRGKRGGVFSYTYKGRRRYFTPEMQKRVFS